MKLALAPLALVVGLSLSACGSDDSSTPDAADEASATPSAAAADPFCEALMATATVQDGKDVADLRETLAATGIPDDAGQDAAAGLDVYLDILGQVDEDATAKDLAKMQDPGLSAQEQAEVDAMVSYATTACSTGAGQAPSDAPESPEAPESSE